MTFLDAMVPKNSLDTVGFRTFRGGGSESP